MRNYKQIFDNSQIVTIQQCPMLYYLQYELGLVRRDKSYVDLDFGDYTHRFLRAYSSGEPVVIPDIWSSFEDVIDEEIKTKQNGIRLCEAYHQEYKNKDKNLVFKEIEDVHYFDLNGINMCVKRDAVVESQGNIYAFESKTTRSWVGNVINSFFINSQASIQTYSTELKYGHCSGVILNILQVKHTTKPALFQPDAPEIKLYSNVEFKYSKYYKQEMAYCSGFNCKLERTVIDRTPQEIEDWKQNVRYWINIILHNRIINEWPKADAGRVCSAFSGCPYRELCKTSIGMNLDEAIMETLYEKKDPYQYLKDES